jgi:tetratricopeptide (TPR) repeat protein
LQAVGLVAAVVLCYWNSLQAPFLFDDDGAVVKNPTIRHLASLEVLNPPANGSTTTNRPVVNLSFAINYALSGEHVWSYHAFNVVIHALAALALLGIVRRTLIGPSCRGLLAGDCPSVVGRGRRTPPQDSALAACQTVAPGGARDGDAALPGRSGAASRAAGAGSGSATPSPANRLLLDAPSLLAFLIALLWALHPLQTETVVCIAQRTESLCGLFYLLTLYCFIRAVEGRGRRTPPPQEGNPAGFGDPALQQSAIGGSNRWLSLSVLACLLGMGAKEVMVTAPLVVLLYDRTFVAGSFSAAWRQRRTYYATLAGTWLLLAGIMVRAGGARGVGAGLGLGVSAWSYLLKQSEAIVLYLKLSFWPHPLVLDYGTAVSHSIADVWWQGIVVLALLGLTIWALVRKPVAGFLGAWFFVILAPSSSVMPILTQTMAEHRMYLPLAGVVGLVVVALYRWAGSRASWLIMGAAVVLGCVTVVRNHDYRDVVTLWADTVAKYPQNARAHNNLAWALVPQGRAVEADAHYARAVELQPDYVTGHYNWGVALFDQGRVAEAITQLEAAVRLAPDHADAHVNLGNALMKARRTADAIPHYETALRLQPGADVHYDLGLAFFELGRTDEAIAHLRTAVQLNPVLAEAQCQLGVALLERGRTAEAAGHLQTALQLNPNFPAAHYELALLAEQAGQIAGAESHYAETLRLAPDDLAAHRKLGLLLARSGRLDSAAEHFRAIIRLAPADADAPANLGNVLLFQGKAREAIVCYEESLRLRPGDARTLESLQLARESLH